MLLFFLFLGWIFIFTLFCLPLFKCFFLLEHCDEESIALILT